MGDDNTICANCTKPMPGLPNVGERGPDVAWMTHCKECAALVKDQMELILDRPNEAPVQIWQCRQCGSTRATRPGLLVRCHACLDERSRLLPELEEIALDILASEPDLRATIAAALHLSPQEVQADELRAWDSFVLPALRMRSAARPGWEVLATDIPGLPFHPLGLPIDHGTWARHVACGRVHEISEGPAHCSHCDVAASEPAA